MANQKQSQEFLKAAIILAIGIVLAAGAFQYLEMRQVQLRNEALRLENEAQQLALRDRQLEQEAERLEEQRKAREQAERRAREEAERKAREEAERRKQAQQAAARQQLNEERRSLAQRYADNAGRQIMDAVGGGQDSTPKSRIGDMTKRTKDSRSR